MRGVRAVRVVLDGPHGRACLQVGNTKTEVVAALVHCFPYIGFPRAVAAVRAVKDL